VNPRKKASERRSVRFEGMNIAYASRGRGETALIFVHGWSCDRSFWDAQMNSSALARGRRLLALDLPGHGESDKPAIRYSMDLFARAIVSVLDDAGIRRAVLVGHSMGTPVIRQFYRLHPARTAGLAIVDGPLKPFSDDPASWEQFIAPLRGADYLEWAGKFVDERLQPATDAAERDQPCADLILQDTGERAGRRGERHGDDRCPPVDDDAADESEVHDVHRYLGIIAVAERVHYPIHCERFGHDN